MAAACSKKFPIKRTALWDMKNKKKNFFPTDAFVFFQVSSETQVFFLALLYVEPPPKSTTANNNLRSDDDAIEIETSEIVQQKKLILQKYQKQISWLYYITTPVKMVTFV